MGRRMALAEEILPDAHRQNRVAVIAETAPATKTRTIKLEAPADARATLAGAGTRALRA